MRLRRPHGNVNPNGFDYEAWLLERGIGATGYVRSRGEQRLLGRRDSALDRVEQAREAVRDRFHAVLGATPAAGILAALAVGDQRAISAEEWRLFNRTGVTHLMSISGLHVTLVSGLAAWLVAVDLAARAAAGAAPARAQGRRGRGDRRRARLYAARGLRGAGAAHLLHGDRGRDRALVRRASPRRCARWRWRLAVVLAADPWAPLSPGFWLSFGAVALIFYVAAGWTGREHRVAQWVRVQWAITVGLAPAALLLFGQVSIAGPLANAVAIPVVSVIVHAARASRGADPGRLHARARRAAGRMAAAVPRVVRGAARRALAAARAAALGRGARARRRGSGCSRRAACPGAARVSR